MEFQMRLYQLRKERGLSQENLADVLGVTRQAVQKWESGASRPDMENLIALAKYFDVTLDWLLTGAESAPAEPAGQTIIHYNYYHAFCYEYRSRRTLFGLPLIHINLGRGLCLAQGIIAIGNVAAGGLALGGISLGAVSLGALSLGGLALGGLAAGTIAVGGFAVGLTAWGGISLGILAVGGLANGVYAVGGVANALRIAIGSLASAPLAIGDSPSGAQTFLTDGSVPLETIRTAISQAAPPFLQDFLTFLAAHIHSVPLQ